MKFKGWRFFDTLYHSFSTTWKIRVHSFLNVLCVFTSLLPLAASTTSPLPILPKQVVPNARESKTSKGKKNGHPGALRIIKAVSFSFSLNSRAWLSKGSEKIDQPKKAIPEMKRLSSWWLNHPSEKYARQNGNLPHNRGENKKISETTTQLSWETKGTPPMPTHLTK